MFWLCAQEYFYNLQKRSLQEQQWPMPHYATLLSMLSASLKKRRMELKYRGLT